MDQSHVVSSDISDFVGRVRRHWWVVLVCVLIGLAAGAVFTSTQPRVYQSRTSVLVQPTGAGQEGAVAGGRTKGELNLDTEAQLVRSTLVAADAGKLLRVPTAPERLAEQVSVEVPANTSVLVITYAARDPRTAQAASHAFAEAYLRNREESAKADLAGQVAVVDAKLKQLNAALAPVNTRLATLPPVSPERASLENQRQSLLNQINTLTGRMNQLGTTTISAGKIIRDAELPAAPSKPSLPINLASAGMVGLLLGVALSLLRERFDKRVRRVADLTRRTDVQVLAALPNQVKPRLDDVFPPFGTAGRLFNRLRNEILASLPGAAALRPVSAFPIHLPPVGPLSAMETVAGLPPVSAIPAMPQLPASVIVVTGASRGAAVTVVAANLAAAFARTGSETVLIAAQLPDSIAETAPVTRLFGVAAMPGLSDVLAGRVGLDEATQRAPRTPRLSVVTTGGTASAGGLLQSQGLRDMINALREQAEYVIIEAPSTATSADAQTLASVADAAIIVVELRRTRYAEVTDASEQLRRVATPLLGAVVVPRLARNEEQLAADTVALRDHAPRDPVARREASPRDPVARDAARPTAGAGIDGPRAGARTATAGRTSGARLVAARTPEDDDEEYGDDRYAAEPSAERAGAAPGADDDYDDYDYDDDEPAGTAPLDPHSETVVLTRMDIDALFELQVEGADGPVPSRDGKTSR